LDQLKVVHKNMTLIKSKLSKFRKGRRFAALIAVFAILVLTPLAIYIARTANQTSAAWFDDTWAYRKGIIITYTGSTTLTNFQIELDEVDVDGLNTAGKIQDDCSDLRFTDVQGKVLDYWIEDENDAADSIDCTASDYDIWVNVPEMEEDIIIYMYYGNPSAASYSNGDKTFDFF